VYTISFEKPYSSLDSEFESESGSGASASLLVLPRLTVFVAAPTAEEASVEGRGVVLSLLALIYMLVEDASERSLDELSIRALVGASSTISLSVDDSCPLDDDDDDDEGSDFESCKGTGRSLERLKLTSNRSLDELMTRALVGGSFPISLSLVDNSFSLDDDSLVDDSFSLDDDDGDDEEESDTDEGSDFESCEGAE
jgi:hypothetical protein